MDGVYRNSKGEYEKRGVWRSAIARKRSAFKRTIRTR
jgi:hypothetical protein